MHKLAITILSTIALLASPVAAARPGAPARAPASMDRANHLTDENPVPVWVLGLMGAVGVVIAVLVATDGRSDNEQPDSN